MKQKKILPVGDTVKILLIAAALLLLLIDWKLEGHWPFIPRGLVFLVWIFYWGMSVNRRVIHARVRRYLVLVAFLMASWIIVRTLKWDHVHDPGLIRFLWYLYYIPMLMIPLLSVFVAVSLGKPENSRLPGLFRYLFGINGLLFLMVLTNDLHQKVFSFPADAVVWSDKEYDYGIGFVVIMVWSMACGLAAFLVMLRKARVLRSKTILLVPILSMGSLLVYVVCYALGVIPHIYPIYDLVFVFCLLVLVTLEGCIRSGLIQSNTRYTELFQLSAIDGQIADKQFQVLLTSGDSTPLSPETVRRVAAVSQETKENTRLLCAPLKNGYVLWKEDISEIAEILAELADEDEYLTTRKTVLQKEVDTHRKERMLIEKNRLYNTLMDETKGEIDSFARLLDRIEESSDQEEIKRLTKRLSVLCTHIKRRSNLLLLAEENHVIEACELQYAVEEWLSNLRMGGVLCDSVFDMKTPLALSDMLFFYNAIQQVLLYILDNVKYLLVNCFEREGQLCLRMSLTCEGNFDGFSCPGITVFEEEGDDQVLEIVLPAGGDRS